MLIVDPMLDGRNGWAWHDGVVEEKIVSTAAVTASFHSTISKCVFKEWYGSSCVSEDMRQRQILVVV